MLLDLRGTIRAICRKMGTMGCPRERRIQRLSFRTFRYLRFILYCPSFVCRLEIPHDMQVESHYRVLSSPASVQTHEGSHGLVHRCCRVQSATCHDATTLCLSLEQKDPFNVDCLCVVLYPYREGSHSTTVRYTTRVGRYTAQPQHPHSQLT